MSDYFNRLVQRAMPRVYPESGKLSEVKPAIPFFGNSFEDMHMDFEPDADQQFEPIGTSHGISAPSQSLEIQPMASSDQAEEQIDKPGQDASKQVTTSNGPSVIQSPGHNLRLNMQDERPGQVESILSVHDLELTVPDGEFGKEHDSPLEEDTQLQPDLVVKQNSLTSSVDIRIESTDPKIKDVMDFKPGNAAQVLLLTTQLRRSYGGEISNKNSVTQLQPLAPTLSEIFPVRQNSEKLVIGSLKVEVLPEKRELKSEQPAIQVTQIIQPTHKNENLSSKLRFGLRQM